MTTTADPTSWQAAPDDEESAQAAQAIELLQAYLEGHDAAMRSMHMRLAGTETEIELPASAVVLLKEILAELANGNAVTVAPVYREVTSQQAADLLNVSRPYLVGLLDQGLIPFRRVGNRRRIRLDDVLAYKQREEIHRQKLLEQLTSEAEDLGVEY